MKRIAAFIVALWMAMSCYAVDFNFQTGPQGSHCQTGVAPTVAYTAPPTDFRTTSAFRSSNVALTSSFSEISESNFQSLNSGPKKAGGRPPGGGGTGGGGQATGEIEWEYPLGDIPFLLIALLALAYGVARFRKDTRCRN